MMGKKMEDWTERDKALMSGAMIGGCVGLFVGFLFMLIATGLIYAVMTNQLP